MCNQDSAFYKKDTVTFVTQFYGCCNYFTPTIKNKRVIEIHGGQACNEPPTITLSLAPIKGRIKKIKSETTLVLFKDYDLCMKFKIPELTQKQYTDSRVFPGKYYSMTLVREKAKPAGQAGI